MGDGDSMDGRGHMEIGFHLVVQVSDAEGCLLASWDKSPSTGANKYSKNVPAVPKTKFEIPQWPIVVVSNRLL